MKRMIQIYLDMNKNISYQLDRDTVEIYTLNGNFRQAASIGGNWIFILVAFVTPIIVWFIEPIRSRFDLNFLTRESNIIITTITILTFIVIGFFLPEIGSSNVVKKILKTDDIKYEEQFSQKYGLLIQTKRERESLIKKSLWQKIYLFCIIGFATIFFIPNMMTAFINDSNLLTYILLSMLSLILIAPMITLIRGFFIILKIVEKEGVSKKEYSEQKFDKEKKKLSTIILFKNQQLF